MSEEFKHLEELLEGSDEEAHKTGPGIIQKAYDVLHGDGSGQRIELHHDGTSLSLPPFEIEMRRRLWWQIVVPDTQIAELSGAGTSMLSMTFDTHLPSNTNDSNLNPEMAQLPPEHPGATDMTFCLAKYEFGFFLKRSGTDFFFFEGAWAKPDGAPVSLVEKDRAIDELALRLEEKYIVHCDTNITLHFLTKIFTRTARYRMRLVAHHPRRHLDKGVSMPPEEKEFLSRLSLNIVENDNLSHSNKSADKFAWYVNMNFPFPAFIYLISELRHRTSGELSDRGWAAMKEAFRNRIKFIAAKRESPMFKATSILALKAWQAREVDAAAHGTRSASKEISISDPGSLQVAVGPNGQRDVNVKAEQTQAHAHPGLSAALEPVTEPGMNSTEWSPMDWSYWENLVQIWDAHVSEGSR
ncbi:MAG: hypothetical protein Q9209_007406 [Squamulea sp. 1 TL-2023]